MKPKKLEAITVTMQEIWQQTTPKVHKSKKHYSRKDKHKKNPDRQNPDFFYSLIKVSAIEFKIFKLSP